MKFRAFELRDGLTQLQYIDFRENIENFKPKAWVNIETLPAELFYSVMCQSAIKAGWLSDVVEKNEYGEETSWSWSVDYFNGLPAGKFPLQEWGALVLERWVELKTLDPN